ncbi:hypothetical protein K435DRAFT_904915 [Dendrothele bispora CBS 962.96]|uniref:Uncharacterized protein n=1 Tax=Dendrothele bispora (strain CBS 962.96) TaxID=1314807 RepID=A0A4S8LU86_DENBC|nr:hypothetical protein K435DRAFT_904915 [Dendrothele bispora CBS 962.96]
MPNEMKGQYSQCGGAISKMATETLKGWRNSIGEAAITIVEQILDGKNEEERETFIHGQINSEYRDRPYYYPDNNTERSEKRFQSQIVSKTFSTHFEVIKNIPDDSRSEALPKAALVLSILAIDRAFVLSRKGILWGDFSSNQLARHYGPRIHQLVGESSKGQDSISANLWSEIIAAAKSHVELQTSTITSSIPSERKRYLLTSYTSP